MNRLAPLLLLLLFGCADAPDGGEPDDGGCPDGFEALCGDLHCAPPVARVATGHSEASFAFWQDGDPAAVEFGGQNDTCCYHVMVGVETEGLCPVVWIEFELALDVGVGEPIPLWESLRHVQMVRLDGSRQQFWGVRAMIPCSWWPDDVDNPNKNCGDEMSAEGFVEDHELIYRVTVTDHDDRVATDVVRLDPWCCDRP